MFKLGKNAVSTPSVDSVINLRGLREQVTSIITV